MKEINAIKICSPDGKFAKRAKLLEIADKKTKNLSSHIDMQKHANNAFDNRIILTTVLQVKCFLATLKTFTFYF